MKKFPMINILINRKKMSLIKKMSQRIKNSKKSKIRNSNKVKIKNISIFKKSIKDKKNKEIIKVNNNNSKYNKLEKKAYK